MTNESKGKPEQKFDVAFGIIFRISSVFKRSQQTFHVIFYLDLGRLKIYKLYANVQKVLI